MNFSKGTIIVLTFLAACDFRELPHEKYFQFNMAETKSYFQNDSIYFFLQNSLNCPLRYYISSVDSSFNRRLQIFQPVTLQQNTDTLVKISADSIELKGITMRNFLGDLSKKVDVKKLTLPFCRGRQIRIIQGYNGSYSHNTNDYFRNSIDFALATNDTVCAADNGFVVGVIEGYTDGGSTRKWQDYANFITVYHPHSGIFTQYVHLNYNGSFVDIGDTVISGQPIGLAGKTGRTDVEHLHFQALVPAEQDLLSIKTSFVEGYEGDHLKKDDVVRK